jgi:serine/threonine-protein kinase RsbW
MSDILSPQILGRVRKSEFVGRDADVRRVCALANTCSITLLLGDPRAGKSELLRQSFDRLFNNRSQVVPFFYVPRSLSADLETFARDYFSQTLSQFLAFRRGDPKLIYENTPLASVARVSTPDDRVWVGSLVDSFVQATKSGDESLMVRSALATPAAACSYAKLTALVMIDECQWLSNGKLGSELQRALESGRPDVAVTHVLTGKQRIIVDLIPGGADLFNRLKTIQLDRLSEEDYEKLVSSLAESRGIEISESTIELMSQQLDRDVFFTRAVIDAALSRGSRLQTFIDFERLYTGEVMGGRIGHYFDAVVRDAASNTREARMMLEAMMVLTDAGAPMPIESFVERAAKQSVDGELLIEKLHLNELANATYGFVHASKDPVLSDYVRAKHRSEIAGAGHPAAGDELLREKLKDSYRLMMSRYNRAIQSQLIELLSRFDFQSVPASLFDNAAFEKRYRGMSRVQVRRAVDDEGEQFVLPQMVVVNDLGPIDEAGPNCRLFSACGFEGGIYTEANEVLWLVALINSKEPLDVETVGRIDRRIDSVLLEAEAEAENAPRVARWYISKEGFSAVSSERLSASEALRSTYSQLDLIQDCLDKLALSGEARPATEFELIIPVENEAELIAARTAEQIARAADFDQEAINQIKTALIEACINAAEHGDSPDRKIHQRFAIGDNRLIITVSNKGKSFDRADTQTTPSLAAQPVKGTRGRGLQIIRALMDEVEFERTDDGARLVMTKYLRRPDSQ